MQRFKDFTKKSGKVASAILSAAMVTSMVAGTNVVYAATETTEATKNVTKETANQDKKAVDNAIAEYVATVKDFTVTAKTNPDVFQINNGSNGFKDAEDDIKEKYEVDSITAILAAVEDAPTTAETGKRVLTVTITKGGYTSKRTVDYTLDSLSTRADKAKKVAENILADFKPGRNTTEDTAVLNEKLKDAFGEKENGIEIYEDITAREGASALVSPESKEDGKKDEAEATITLKFSNGVTDDIHTKEVTKNYTIASAKDRVKAATEEVQKYLKEAKDLSAVSGGAVTSDTTKASIEKYLRNNGYSDVKVVDKNGAEKDVTVSDVSMPTVYADGEAKAKFKLAAFFKNGSEGWTEGDEVKDFTIALPSDQTKTDAAAAELKNIADKITVTADTEATDYHDDFETELKKLYAPKYASVTSAAAITDVQDGEFDLTSVLKTVYGNDAYGYVSFADNDATSDKDGAKKVIIIVGYGKAPSTRIEKVYAVDSAQSEIDKAKTAVEAALDGMTFTSATTKADVEAVVAEALKAYPEVESVVTYVADNGTASVGVTLTKTVNGVTKKATVEKSYSFLSNTFVEKDGKKFYYDANGQLLKNTWLQGTDSPDGYTYYIQNDGSVMQDRLTYHPDGEHVIYFDKDGHEVFDAFVNVKADAQGNPVDYIGYFDTFGYAYVNQTTYGNGEGAYAKDALFYINDYGVLENKGWFQNAAGEIGYAAPNGTLTTSQWSLDQFGRKVYFQANGFLAKGLMTDGVKYYQLDENDGHLVGEF